MPRQEKDYSAVRQKVQRAAVLMAEGLSEKRAASEVGLPRTSLQRYLEKGLPDGPIWPEGAHCPQEHEGQIRNLQELLSFEEPTDQRDERGRFLPGNRMGEVKNRPAREAKRKLEEFAPQVAERLIKTFNALPGDRPEMILAYAREILDRGLGKPTQTLDITETSLEQHEYKFIQEVILHDEDALRLAVAFSQHLEGHARDHGPEAEPGQMAAPPAPE